jgi:hypothetical protein
MNYMSQARLADLPPDIDHDGEARRLIGLLASGGDERIVLDPATGLNRYFSAPYPRITRAFASSTANDVSRAAFEHGLAQLRREDDYGSWLSEMRGRLRAAYGIEDDVAVVFAPSGTDLEYVALVCAPVKAGQAMHNILLGADEVGSGCIHSAAGRYFAKSTALGAPTEPGAPVEGLENVTLADVPLRCPDGRARSSASIRADFESQLATAREQGRHAVVHVVHGSKTGMIAPALDDLDALSREWGEHATFVVDACQARISSKALSAYLERGFIVFLTGSKFMGGPPFSGMALVPPAIAREAEPLPAGLRNVFLRKEWPEDWPGSAILPEGSNHGLALRLELSIFELERFQALPFESARDVIETFQDVLKSELAAKMGIDLVTPWSEDRADRSRRHPLAMLTLATLDLSSLPGFATFEDARQVHRQLALDGLRLGQPVKSVRTDAGEWGGTMRVGLSMPQITELAALTEETLRETMESRIREVREALQQGGA